jgi:hypothetical protein
MKLDRSAFIDRFVAAMLRIAGPKFDDGDSIEAYARDTAPSYFEEQYQDDDLTTPEECAAVDISYWEH